MLYPARSRLFLLLVAAILLAGPTHAETSDWWLGLAPECARPIGTLNLAQIDRCATLQRLTARFKSAGFSKEFISAVQQIFKEAGKSEDEANLMLIRFAAMFAAAREEEAAHPMSERERCYAALPQFRDGCDKKIEADDARKRASGESRDPPGTTGLCPPPYRMTEKDGCQPPTGRQ